jgi:hypothetical protein
VQPVAGHGPSSGGSLSWLRPDGKRRVGAGFGRKGPWQNSPSSLVTVAAGRARASFEPDLAEVPSPAATWMASPISPIPVKARQASTRPETVHHHEQPMLFPQFRHL